MGPRFRMNMRSISLKKDFDRFARLGVIAWRSRINAADDGRWAAKRIGEERCKLTYPFRHFLDKNVTLTFGSD